MINKTEQEIIQNWQGNIHNPVVSICCITYNHENYIAEALDSFLMQETDFPFEVIVRDDASPDKTAEIIREYESKYPNIIKPIYEKENGYQKGIKASPVTFGKAKGEYIALCEGDDYWTDAKKLQVQIDEMKKYPEVDFSFHLASTIDNFNIEAQPKLQKRNRFYSTKDIITANFHLIQTNTIVFKKKNLESLNYDLIAKSPVGDVWIRVNASIPNGALFINKIMSTYRIHSQGSWSESMQEENKFIKYIHNMINSVNSFDKYYNFKYTNEFLIYKNMFITAVMKKDINQTIKNNFINDYKSLMSMKNLIQWNILYKYPLLVNFFRFLKNKIKE